MFIRVEDQSGNPTIIDASSCNGARGRYCRGA